MRGSLLSLITSTQSPDLTFKEAMTLDNRSATSLMTSLLDPCNSGTPVEDIIKALDQIREEVGTIHMKDQEKTTHKVLCIWHILEARRIPKVIDMSEDDEGNKIISEIDPDYLNMSSEDWELQGLNSMGEHVDIVSMYGADLEDNQQTEKMKRAFLNYPPEILGQGIKEIHKIFSKFFQMENYPSEQSERYGPISQMRPMQEVLIIIQNRCANAVDELVKTASRTASKRPSTLDELRSLKLALKRFVQILEYGKFEAPGSREDEYALMLCRTQAKMEGSRFPASTQAAIAQSLISPMKSRKDNKELLTIKTVISTIHSCHDARVSDRQIS